MVDSPANILLVDDQPAKLVSYKAVLEDLGEPLLMANSARKAFQILLKHDVAVVLIDVCMPETDGFELAAMIREHPRFEKTALIFVSAVFFDEVDRIRGYAMGAVDYVTVPVIPEILRAKVKVFLELYRKTKQLEQFNQNLEARVAERTAELAASSARLRQAEQLRSLALAAGQMGSWEWDAAKVAMAWDQGQYEIFGVEPATFIPTLGDARALVLAEDLEVIMAALQGVSAQANTIRTEFRVRRPSGELRSCVGVAAASFDDRGKLVRISGVTVDVTDRKRDEERQVLLAGEVDHRARNVVAVIQAIVRLTRAATIEQYIAVLEGRISALSTAHRLLAGSRWQGADLGRLAIEEAAPYQDGRGRIEISGPEILLPPAMAQTIALALHELITNAAKYGALCCENGRVRVGWLEDQSGLHLTWTELGGPKVNPPSRRGYGMRVIKAGVEAQLGGTATFQWHSGGLACTLFLPYKRDLRTAVRKAADTGDDMVGAATVPGTPVAGERTILVVEDEPLISMMFIEMLAESGHKIDGPYSKLSDALAAARNNDLCGGILDVNVRGEAVYPVADALAARKIPFIFVTGYGANSIDGRFNQVPVLQKPVEVQNMRSALAGLNR